MKGGWLVGALAVVVLAYITVNTLRSEAVRGLEPGTRLPPFAMPLAVGDLEGDARISGDACSVRGPDVLTSCEIADGRPAVLAFVVTSAGDCEDQVGTLDRAAQRFPGVAFAAVGVRGDRDDLRELVRERGWEVPVGYDHDGAVSIRYGLAGVCPLVTFVRADGRVAGSTVGVLGERELAARVEALQAGRPLP